MLEAKATLKITVLFLHDDSVMVSLGKYEVTRTVKKKLDGETKVLDGAVLPYYYGWSF